MVVAILRNFFALLSVLILLYPVDTESATFVGDKVCGTLYSAEEFQGDSFILKDWDQSVNTKTDYRTSISGWWNTNSIKVEKRCTMTFCSEVYMHGSCDTFPFGEYKNSTKIEVSPIRSVNCSCARDCNCHTVIIPKNNYTCGRAYLEGGCNTCEAEYIQLSCSGSDNFPAHYSESIRDIILRSGCSLSIYYKVRRAGTSREITGTVTEDFVGNIASYSMTCDDDAYVVPPRPDTYPPLINADELLNLLSTSDPTVSTHPGVKAALESLMNGRSRLHAYVLVIGTQNLIDIDIFGCEELKKKNTIGECHISVSLDKIGVSSSQLRILYAILTGQDESSLATDAKWVIAVEDYLKNHEELKDAIPNAVIVFHRPAKDFTIAEIGSDFQRKLSVVNSLRGRLLDETYSNMIVVVEGSEDFIPPGEINPESRLTEYEEAIKINWAFPKPIVIVESGNSTEFERTNGHAKMRGGHEYWPKNMQEQLVLLAKQGDDHLGLEIFKEAFPEERELQVILSKETELLSPEEFNVDDYIDMLEDPDIARSQSLGSSLENKFRYSCQPLIYSMPRNETQCSCNLDVEIQIEEMKTMLLEAEDRWRKAEEQMIQVERELSSQIDELRHQNSLLGMQLAESRMATEDTRKKTKGIPMEPKNVLVFVP